MNAFMDLLKAVSGFAPRIAATSNIVACVFEIAVLIRHHYAEAEDHKQPALQPDGNEISSKVPSRLRRRYGFAHTAQAVNLIAEAMHLLHEGKENLRATQNTPLKSE